MSWLDLPRSTEPEEIDNPGQPYSDLARSMADVALLNRLFWGTGPVVREVAKMLRGARLGTTVRILDIATGSGDIPRAIINWGKCRGHNIEVVGVDNIPAMLRIARADGGEFPLILADARRLPFAPKSFDIALCSLAFHHFGFDSSAVVLRAMDSLTTRGFVVSDLRRDHLALALVRLGIELIRPHPFTRHDSQTSVRRAYTPRECEKLIALSGVRNARIFSAGYARLLIVQRKRE